MTPCIIKCLINITCTFIFQADTVYKHLVTFTPVKMEESVASHLTDICVLVLKDLEGLIVVEGCYLVRRNLASMGFVLRTKLKLMDTDASVTFGG